jgi:hypothetical protein
MTNQNICYALSGSLFAAWLVYTFGISGILFVGGIAALVAAELFDEGRQKSATPRVDMPRADV